MIQLIGESFGNRELIWALAIKDLRVRYKRSILGFVWALLHPLLLMIVLTIVFSTIFNRAMDHYSIFLISGLFPWTFFSQSTHYCLASIVGNGPMLKKVYLHKSVFPLSAVLANLINFALSMIPLLLMILAFRFPFHWTWVYFPVPLICLTAFTLGFGLICAAINVFFRDFSHIIEILLSAWFYFSAIIFPLDFYPSKYLFLFRLNPILYILDGFQKSIYYGVLPSTDYTILCIFFSFVVLFLGYLIFRKYQDQFIYYL